jgi:Protein of unknown function (DUF559)
VAVAERQHGVVSTGQLRELRLDKFWVARRVAAGFLHPLHHGVYAVGRPGISLRGRYLGAVLACSQARTSHRSAAHLWDLRSNAAGLVEVTVAHAQAGPAGVRVHRSRMLDPRDFTVRDGIPVTSLARTLLDLAAVLRPNDLEVAVDRAERLGLFDLDAVVDVLDRAKGRKGAKALRRVLGAYELSTQRSELERAFKRLIEPEHHIPSPSFNAVFSGESRAHEVDALWEKQRLAVQLDGFEFHRTRRDRERDASSDADLELAGYRVIRLTWDDVHVNWERTLRRLRLALGVA